MDETKYPSFVGNVISISEIIEDEEEVMSTVWYLEPEDMPSEGQALLEYIRSFREEDGIPAPSEIEKKAKRALVPMRLDPSVLEGCLVRAHVFQRNGDENKYKVYEIEILKGQFTGSMFPVERHKGFKYVKILEKIDK